LADEETRTEALGVLRTLIEAVLIHPIESGYEIELVGEITNMVDLAAGASNKKAALGGAALSTEDRRSVKLVAGAGFEPTTFRL
jgi:site-specific DNA recombinase